MPYQTSYLEDNEVTLIFPGYSGLPVFCEIRLRLNNFVTLQY